MDAMSAGRGAVVSIVMAACACATSGTPAPMNGAGGGAGAQATGELLFRATGAAAVGASFDASHVMGPRVNMAMAEGGAWAGDLDGRNVVLSVEPGHLSGAGVDLHVERQGDALAVRGLYGQHRVDISVTPKSIRGTSDGGRCSYDLTAREPRRLAGTVGCTTARGAMMPQVATAELKIAGEGAQLSAPALPQFVLALLAVVPM